ncbi:MAG: hypothetical protein KDM63_18155, partial [Verrucomicrobiae bacterium]|nr:hypothetical protein [Verrucomicrobiae bacterium]
FWFGRDGFALKRHDGEIEKHEAPPGTAAIYALEADAFADTVSGKAKPWLTKEDSLGNMRVLDTLRRSAGVPVP